MQSSMDVEGVLACIFLVESGRNVLVESGLTNHFNVECKVAM